MELAGRMPFGKAFELAATLSLVSGGGEEQFRSLRYSIIRPDGSEVLVYDVWDEPLDQGPSWNMGFGLGWRLDPGHHLQLNGRIGGRVDFSYEKGGVEGAYSYPLLLDLIYRCPGFARGRDSFLLRATNLLDQGYRQPDFFGPAEGSPLQATVTWQYSF